MIIGRRRRERGVAVLIMLFMVSFMLVYLAANSDALFNLKREIKLVDRQQQARWAGTNRVDRAASPKAEEKK